MAGTFGSNPIRRSPPHHQARGNTVRLRLEFFSYEREVIEAQISGYIKKLSRRNPNFIPQDYQLLHIHDVMQFQIIGEHSHMLAYDFFQVEVNLIQKVRPAKLYLSATLRGFEQHFPNASYMDAIIDSLGRSTVLRLNTEDGFLETPPLPDLTVESELIVSTFHLNILLENLSFAMPPFQVYSPVEARSGTLHFPTNPSYFGHPVQQTQYYTHQLPTFSVPAPVLEPPQLINTGNDDSIPWNTVQQRYMDQNRARNDQHQHVQTVRDRLRPFRANVSADNVSVVQPDGSQPTTSASVYPSPSAPVPTNPPPSASSLPDPTVVPQLPNIDPTPNVPKPIVQPQPVIGSLDPNAPVIPNNQPGLVPQPHPGDAVLPAQSHPGTAVPTSQPGSAVSTQSQFLQPGSATVDDVPSDDSVPGATSLVHRTTYPGDPRLQDLLDNMVITSPTGTPTYKFNFPHLLQDPLRFDDSRYRLTNIADMHWDDISLNLSHNIDYMVPQPCPRPPQQSSSLALTHVGPPLAQSVAPPSTSPRYPTLPTVSNALFGPRSSHPPVPSYPAPHNIPHGSLAFQPPVPDPNDLPNYNQSVTDDQIDPAMTAPQAVAAAEAVVYPGQPTTVHNVPDSPTVTGTRQRTPSGNTVQPAHPVSVVSSPVTRGQLGISKQKQFSHDFVTHGKILLGVTKKKKTKRSVSEPNAN